jgi:hypothetical protein
MQRLLLFLIPAAVLAAGLQLHRQHSTGAGLAPQQQAITQLATEIHQSVCR